MEREPAPDRQSFVSTLPAGPGERRLALVTVLASPPLFVVAVPLAKVPLSPVLAFIPIYQSALVVNDLITAVLLFGQFAILRSRALLLLAGGYLCLALASVCKLARCPDGVVGRAPLQ